VTTVPNNVIVNEDSPNVVTVSPDPPANNVVITEDTASIVLVDQYAPNQVVVRIGSASSIAELTKRYIHTQASPSTSWSITHPLGGRPSVTVVDSAGTVVIGEVLYISNTQVTVSFTAPFSGYAYLT
jgi:hypothetical protein